MYYFEVLVAGVQYHGNEALTYSADTSVKPGSVVLVSLRTKLHLGIVVRAAQKPNFVAKPIQKIFDVAPLSPKTFVLIAWIAQYYPAPLGAIVQLFLPNTLLEKHVEAAQTSALSTPNSDHLPPLTKEQSSAVTQIKGAGTFLIHGETGSGKTRVYVELALKAIQNQTSALILTPEIGLTSQLAETFRAVFGERVIVMHSQLTGVARQK